MSNLSKQELVDQIINLGKEDALEIAKSLLDYYQVDLKGTEFIDELIEIGVDYDIVGKPEKALDIYFKAEKRAKAVGDKQGLGSIYSNIGMSYNATKEYNKALEFYLKALEIIEESNDPQELGILYNNIGYVYKNILKYVDSVKYYLKSVACLLKASDKFSLTASYYNLSEVFFAVDDYENALEYINKCIELDRELELKSLKNDIRFRAQIIEKQGGKVKNDLSKSEKKLKKANEELLKGDEDEKDNKKSWLWKWRKS